MVDLRGPNADPGRPSKRTEVETEVSSRRLLRTFRSDSRASELYLPAKLEPTARVGDEQRDENKGKAKPGVSGGGRRRENEVGGRREGFVAHGRKEG